LSPRRPGKAADVRGPLAKSYPAAVALVIFALVPYLGLTGALVPLSSALSRGVHLSRSSLELTDGLANAAYAFGTVLSVQLALHLPQRRMLVLYAALFVAGSVLAAGAPAPAAFITGHVLQGLCTSLMLIAAAPPLVTGWPVAKMPRTAATMNLCVFGAVAAGPSIGGLAAAGGDWRALLWIVAGVGALALLLAMFTFEDDPPADPDAPWDIVALCLAGGGCAAAFFGASELGSHGAGSALVLAPLIAGVAALIGLVTFEYGVGDPLMPVRQFASTIPLAGIVTAMCAGGASVAVIEVAQAALGMRTGPSHEAMLFLPELGAAVLAAVVFGAVLRTRLLPLLALGGLIVLAAGAALLRGVATAPYPVVMAGTGLVGIGVGAAVVPALFCVGFSLASGQIQRVFALIELLRGAAAFLAAPILLHVALAVGSPAAGAPTAGWIAFALVLGGAAVAFGLYVAGGARLRAPAVEQWDAGEGPALDSPPPLARLRRRSRGALLARTE
jgi:MFS family permease